MCFPEDANTRIDECFKIPEKQNRLYNIRNAINRGDINAENPEELLRVEWRLDLLQKIVVEMFGRLIQLSSSTQDVPKNPIP